MATLNGVISPGGGGAGGPSITGGTAVADNAVIRGDGTTALQGSTATILDSGKIIATVTSPESSVAFHVDSNGENIWSLDRGTANNYGAIRLETAGTSKWFFGLSSNTDFAAAASDFVLYDYNGLALRFVVRDGSGDQSIPAAAQRVWGATTADSAADIGLARSAAGVVKVTDGSSGNGSLLSNKLVEANVAGSGAPNVLVASESGTVLTNEGATAENYHTLPAAVAGLEYTFIVQDTDGIRITAAAGDTIRPIAGTAASATGGFIRCATAGAYMRLQAINNTEWICVGSAGVWTIDV